jgi:DNA-binding protein Alba
MGFGDNLYERGLPRRDERAEAAKRLVRGGGADRSMTDHGPTGATVFIGQKPTMTYVFQVVSQLNSGAGPVVVKARGNAIGKAVDVVEVVRRRFLVGQVAVGTIVIDTERLVNREGREANVSSIAIPLSRTGPAPGAPASSSSLPPPTEPPHP